MKDIIQLLINYWKPIVGVLFTLFGFIIALLKKRPLGNVYTLIFRYCLAAVIMAEEHPVKGKEKLELAIDAVNELLLDDYPTLNVDSYRKSIVDCIEAILSTPHKKDK